MTEAERDSLLNAVALAVRDLQHRHDRLADLIHNINQRLCLQEAALVIEEIQEGDICAKH